MSLIRIRDVVALEGMRLRLTLTDGTVVERDLSALLVGPVFESIRSDPGRFREVRAESGTLVWPNGADLCPGRRHLGRPPAHRKVAPPDSRCSVRIQARGLRH